MDQMGRSASRSSPRSRKPQAVEERWKTSSGLRRHHEIKFDLGVECPSGCSAGPEARVRLARIAAKPVIVATRRCSSMIRIARDARRGLRLRQRDPRQRRCGHAFGGLRSAFPDRDGAHDGHVIESTEENGGERIASSPATADRCPASSVRPRRVRNMDARYLVTFSQSGTSARLLSRMRRPIPMLAFHAARVDACRLASRGVSDVPRSRGAAHRRHEQQLSQVVQSAPGGHR